MALISEFCGCSSVLTGLGFHPAYPRIGRTRAIRGTEPHAVCIQMVYGTEESHSNDSEWPTSEGHWTVFVGRRTKEIANDRLGPAATVRFGDVWGVFLLDL